LSFINWYYLKKIDFLLSDIVISEIFFGFGIFSLADEVELTSNIGVNYSFCRSRKFLL